MSLSLFKKFNIENNKIIENISISYLENFDTEQSFDIIFDSIVEKAKIIFQQQIASPAESELRFSIRKLKIARD